jgi:hypothetical protein
MLEMLCKPRRESVLFKGKALKRPSVLHIVYAHQITAAGNWKLSFTIEP